MGARRAIKQRRAPGRADRRVVFEATPAAAPVRRISTCALHRAPVGQGPSNPDWLAIVLGFWSGRALSTGTAWAGLCLIHHHHRRTISIAPTPDARRGRCWVRHGFFNAKTRAALLFFFVVITRDRRLFPRHHGVQPRRLAHHMQLIARDQPAPHQHAPQHATPHAPQHAPVRLSAAPSRGEEEKRRRGDKRSEEERGSITTVARWTARQRRDGRVVPQVSSSSLPPAPTPEPEP